MTNRSALIAWLVGVMAVGIGGLLPDDYRRQVAHARDADAYPAYGVAQFIAVVTVEVLVLWLIGRSRSGRPSTARALVALAIFIPVTLYFGMALMHAPPYQAAHFNWSVGLVLALLVGAVRSGLDAAGTRAGGCRRPRHPVRSRPHPFETRTTAMNPNKALWEKGDFTRLAGTMRGSGEAFVKAIGVRPGMKVLDLGCGDGTTAIPAAQLGADVLGVDIASNLVAAGNRRAEAMGLKNVRFQEGDACDLRPLEDKTFDLVVSVFGAMFAPKPNDVAKEMVRVTKPGGRVVMGNWIPGDPTLVAQVLKISSAYTPPPPEGFVSPMTWGMEASVRERFEAAGIAPDKVAFQRDTFTFERDGTPAQFVDEFRHYYGPTMNAFDAAAKNGRAEALQAELEALFASQNKSGRADRTVVEATFLRVTVQV